MAPRHAAGVRDARPGPPWQASAARPCSASRAGWNPCPGDGPPRSATRGEASSLSSFRRWACDPAHRSSAARPPAAVSAGKVNLDLWPVAGLMDFLAGHRQEAAQILGPSPWDELTDAHPAIWLRQRTRIRRCQPVTDETRYVDDHALAQVTACLAALGEPGTGTITVTSGGGTRVLAGWPGRPAADADAAPADRSPAAAPARSACVPSTACPRPTGGPPVAEGTPSPASATARARSTQRPTPSSSMPGPSRSSGNSSGGCASASLAVTCLTCSRSDAPTRTPPSPTATPTTAGHSRCSASWPRSPTPPGTRSSSVTPTASGTPSSPSSPSWDCPSTSCNATRATPTMSMHYVARRGRARRAGVPGHPQVQADGTRVIFSREDHDGLHLLDRADRFLPNGYCLLPPLQRCEKGNTCLTCGVFVTDDSHLAALQRQLAQTTALMSGPPRSSATRTVTPCPTATSGSSSARPSATPWSGSLPRCRPAPAGPSREQAAPAARSPCPSTPTATGSHSHDRLTPSAASTPYARPPAASQEPRRRPRRPRSAPWSSAASRSPSSPSSAKPTCPTPFSTETLNSETGSNGSATSPPKPSPAADSGSDNTIIRALTARSLISRNNTATKPRPFGPRSNRPTARTWNSGASSPAAAGTRSPQRRNNVTSIATTI